MTMSALRISELLTSGSQPVNTEKPVLIRDQTHSERIVSILWGRRLRRSGQISRDWTFLAVSQILSCGRPDVTLLSRAQPCQVENAENSHGNSWPPVATMTVTTAH